MACTPDFIAPPSLAFSRAETGKPGSTR